MSEITKVLIFSSALYLIPKTFRYLTTDPFNQQQRPLDQRNLNIVSNFRKEAAAYTEIVISNIGRRNWNFMMGVVVDNLWISSLAISIIMRNKTSPIDAKEKVMIGIGYLGLSSLVWCARYKISKILENTNKSVSEFIAPRSFNLGEIDSPSNQEPRRRVTQDQSNPIPERYHNDPILANRVCPITQEPTSNHVGDPTTSGRVTYSRNAAERWLEENRTSPMTRQPLDVSQLEERPVRNMLVNDRVSYLKHQEENKENHL